MEPDDPFDRDPFDRDPFDRHPFDREAPGPRPEPADGDAVEHLWNAAHEMLRAMRTLVDAADEFVESQRGGRSLGRRDREPTGGSRAGRVHHINIEPDTDADRDRDFDAGTGTF